uniref:LTD domain-containing protein n=1 Tax=Syphacia muris TaxID=451379 RepID=A0A0N5AX61_9BILA
MINATALITKHLLILCCYGGTPFVDLQLSDQRFFKHKSTHALDLTDWIAVDTSGSELNSTLFQSNSSKPIVSVPEGVPIEKCDLYNLTFTNTEDENLFDKYKGRIECR